MACLLSAALAQAHLTRVSTASDGTLGNGPSRYGTFSSNGRYVVFASAATNLVTGDTNRSIDVFVKDRQTGTTVRVSVASDGTERVGDSGVRGLDISDDGNVIAFASRGPCRRRYEQLRPRSPVAAWGRRARTSTSTIARRG